jgi:hypothetical protein
MGLFVRYIHASLLNSRKASSVQAKYVVNIEFYINKAHYLFTYYSSRPRSANVRKAGLCAGGFAPPEVADVFGCEGGGLTTLNWEF